jgi:hypothetical protein
MGRRGCFLYDQRAMMKPLRLDDWLCLTVLLGLIVLVSIHPEGEVFLYATSAGTALLALAAVFRADLRQEFLLLGFLLPISLVAATAANHLVVHLTPHTIDTGLLRLDHGFSTYIYHWALQRPWLYKGLGWVYYWLPFYGAFVLCVSPQRSDYARAWIIAAVPAPFFYLAFPAVGPAHLHDPTALRNCIPSLHLTWAALGMVYIGPRWRWVAVAFTSLTAIATLGLGEHYLIDLALAVPYSFAACWIVSRTRQRWPQLEPAGSTTA